MNKQTHNYPRPAVTIDAVTLRWTQESGIAVLLGKRSEDPFQGQWALPGAFLKEDQEAPEDTLTRVLLEKTGTKPKNITLACVRGNPKRDPRGHVVSVAYLTICPHPAADPTPGRNFSEVRWHPLGETLPKVAFDHKEIIREAIAKLHPIRFTKNAVFNLLPREFSIAWLREICQTIAPQAERSQTDPRNFHSTFRKMEKTDIVEETGNSLTGNHRPAKLYRRTLVPFGK